VNKVYKVFSMIVLSGSAGIIIEAIVRIILDSNNFSGTTGIIFAIAAAGAFIVSAIQDNRSK